MKFGAAALSLIALANSASAKFFLRTLSDDPALNAKCVVSYHTGAGTNDAVLADCGPAPAKLYSFSNHRISWTGFNSPGNPVPAGVQFFDNIVTYDSWGPITINIGKGTKGLNYSKEKGFTQNTRDDLGFIVCHWAHNNALQVFNLSYKNPKLPSSCHHVKLVRGCYNTDPGCQGGYF